SLLERAIARQLPKVFPWIEALLMLHDDEARGLEQLRIRQTPQGLRVSLLHAVGGIEEAVVAGDALGFELLQTFRPVERQNLEPGFDSQRDEVLANQC